MRFKLFTLLVTGTAGFGFTYAQITFGSASTGTVLQSELVKHGIKTVFPGDVGYPNATRAYNLRFTVHPVAVTFPQDTQQVSVVVKTSAALGLKVVARSGGHSYIANGLGGTNGSLVVDLSVFKRISFDPATNTAVVEPGNRLGEVVSRLNEVGRAIPHGRCTFVGFGGHSGFGGWGFPSRMWGLTLDNVESATVVLANGTVVDVSDSQHPELFWAIRGSSASFGIVTSLTMKTYAVPPVGTFFQYAWDMDVTNATHAFSSFQTYATDPALPNTFGGELLVLKGSARGRLLVVLLGSHYSAVEEYNRTVAPFLDALPAPTSAKVVSGSWIDVVTAGAAGQLNTTGVEMPRDTFYAKSLMTPEDGQLLTEDAFNGLLKYLAEEGYDSDTFWHVEMELYGGRNSAINAVPLDATAFGHRNTLFTFQPYASTGDLLPPFDNDIFGFVDGMVSSITDRMPNDWAWGGYANYIDSRLDDWQHRYYGQHYERLQALKKSVDPANTFHFPTSIEE
ncbi:hypothetical protein E1B28_011787 [Marasmius oreades]|uniref:FAD-binding PCMH-type domain-containing protein n=1 Tax=Marasmius oreades TaxID=181124 RepID=A0A9P7RV05_9AGAR|nr:uncharacterized protein E1B28_011787 [Marasmius oreades]KAG7090180.1 hypothetical protein E1B28_011787 [Marasmius oreades]